MALLSSFPALALLGTVSSSNPTYVSPTSSQAVTSNSVTLTADYKSALFFLKVNQSSPSSSHLLDVYVAHSPDSGTTFDDFVHFAQVAGKNSGPNTQVAQWIRDGAASSNGPVRPTAASTLAANTVLQGPVGSVWHAIASVSGASSSQVWQVNLSAQVAQ